MKLFNKLQETIGDSSLTVILAMFLYISPQAREMKMHSEGKHQWNKLSMGKYIYNVYIQ